MYVAKILLPVAEGKNKTNLEVLAPLVEALHVSSHMAKNEKFGIIFPNINKNGFGNQMNIYSKNEDALKFHLNTMEVKQAIEGLPYFIEKVSINEHTEYMSVYRINKINKLSPSAIKSSIMLLDRNPELIPDVGTRLFKIKEMYEKGMTKEDISRTLHKETKNSLFFFINSKSSGKKMSLQIEFKKRKSIVDIDWDSLGSYGFSSSTKQTYFPIL